MSRSLAWRVNSVGDVSIIHSTTLLMAVISSVYKPLAGKPSLQVFISLTATYKFVRTAYGSITLSETAVPS